MIANKFMLFFNKFMVFIVYLLLSDRFFFDLLLVLNLSFVGDQCVFERGASVLFGWAIKVRARFIIV